MLSAKPLVICNDAGGPQEFVTHLANGLVVEPEPKAIAEAFDWLYANPAKAKEMGRVGLARFSALGISWPSVVETLLGT
jgi:glycosyltransferase involved in cell wall biosynthesis